MIKENKMATFTPQTILTLQKTEPNKYGNYTEIRVCRWDVDGRVGKPNLEKRTHYKHKESGEMRDKPGSFTWEEFLFCIENKDKIDKAIHSPDQVLKDNAPAVEEVIEDVPF